MERISIVEFLPSEIGIGRIGYPTLADHTYNLAINEHHLTVCIDNTCHVSSDLQHGSDYRSATMSTKKVISTDKAPPPLKGIYNQAIVANGTVYCSGAVAMDPATGKIIDGDVQAHTVSQSSNSPNDTLGINLSAASMYQEPHGSARGSWHQHRPCCESQRLLG